jgi:hypothetical protein
VKFKVGEGKHKCYVNERQTKAYTAWRNMRRRCKDSPSYKEVSICESWHNFQEFAEWFYSNHTEGMVLDKDVLQRGEEFKTYSPATCIFITSSRNSREAGRDYSFVSPEGVLFKVSYGLRKFCIEHNLHSGNLSTLNSGKIKKYKGWTKYVEP